MKKISLFSWIVLLSGTVTLAQQYNIKDKTKYYAVKSDHFNNYSSNGWTPLDDKQVKSVAKALGISKDEADAVLRSSHYSQHPDGKKDNDLGYIMYKVCELKGYRIGKYTYTSSDDILYLMYVPNELNTHMPPDKLAANGNGFFQAVLYYNTSTTPLPDSYYKPVPSNFSKDRYVFGFRYKSNGKDSAEVVKVIKTTSAEKAGLKPGDIIVEVNQKNVRYADRNSLATVFQQSPFTGNSVKVLRNNSEINLKIDKVNENSINIVCASGNCTDGEAVLEHINGYTIKCSFKNGEPVGNAIFAMDGKVFYEGGVRKFSYRGNWFELKFNGKGKLSYPNGDVFEGSFIAGDRSGPGIYTNAGGKTTTGTWVYDKYYDNIHFSIPVTRFDDKKIRVYLHHPVAYFLQNADGVTFDPLYLSSFKSRYNLSDKELDTLFKLCDLKYKPDNLNTPQKIRNIIQANQEKYPYEAYILDNLRTTGDNYISVVQIPYDGNTSLPDAIRFSGPPALYFLVPYSEVSMVNYTTYNQYKTLLQAAADAKAREEQQQRIMAENYEWRQKNPFKGVMIYQFAGGNYNNNVDLYSYKVVSIYGPKNQNLLQIDRPELDKLVGADKNPPVAASFKEGMDEVRAENYISSVLGGHRFSVNNNYIYTIPERVNKTTVTVTEKSEYVKIGEQLDSLDQAQKKLYMELIADQSIEKREIATRALSDILSSKNKTIIQSQAKVQVLDIAADDKLYNANKKFIGKTGTVETQLIDNGDGSFYGIIRFEDDPNSKAFYKVRIRTL